MSATLRQAGEPVDPVRVCAECHRAKTIRGVWYIVPALAETPFLCETCFARTKPARRSVV